MTTIAMIGTGNVGAALGATLAKAGYRVVFGVREGKSADDVAAAAGDNASVASLHAATKAADIVVLAVPGKAVLDAAAGLGTLDGKIVIDCTNPLRWDAGPVWDPPAEGSSAQALAAAHPSARVVKAFNTFGAEFHAEPGKSGHPTDVPLATDDDEARELVMTICRRAGYEPIDAGPLRNASVLENVAMLWIHLALVGGYGRERAFKLC